MSEYFKKKNRVRIGIAGATPEHHFEPVCLKNLAVFERRLPVLAEYWSKTGIRKKYPSLKNYFGLHPHEGVPLGPLEAFLGQNIIFGSIAAVLNTVCWELRPNRVVVK